MGIHGAEWDLAQICALGVEHDVGQVGCAHGTQRGDHARARQFAQLVVDHEHFETALRLDLDAQCPVLVALLEVFLPQVGWLEDVPVGVHSAGVRDLVHLVHVALIAVSGQVSLDGRAHDSPNAPDSPQ